LNSHGNKYHRILNPACLPIPPLDRYDTSIDYFLWVSVDQMGHDCQLKLEAGCRKLEAGNWKPEAGSRKWVVLLVLACGVMLLSCAKHTVKTTAVAPQSVWFDKTERYSSKGDNGEFPVHLFFDLIPNLKIKNNTLHFVRTEREKSFFSYDVDLVSGRLFKRFKYCEQKDIWKKGKDSCNRPPFHIGFVPRLLNPLGTPQKIIVYGNERYFAYEKEGRFSSQKVRVVGGIVRQYCRDYPCNQKRKWVSELIFVAVNPMDPRFKKVVHYKHLQDLIKWDDLTTFLENGDGVNLQIDNPRPAYRLINKMGPNKALNYAFKKGHFFRFEEMKNLRRSCHRLYDFVWKSYKITQLRRYQKIFGEKVPEKKKMDSRYFDIFWDSKKGSTVQNVDLSKKGSKKRKNKRRKEKLGQYENFSKFFEYFYTNYSSELATCQKLVWSSNVNSDRRRHWFFAYLNAYMKLEELELVFDCKNNVWTANPILVSSNKRRIDYLENKKYCTDDDYDRAFNQSITYMYGLHKSKREHYRYIEYDYGVGSSHEKIYSWVKDYGMRPLCVEKKAQAINKTLKSIFPSDVPHTWFVEDKRNIDPLMFE
jgi:hypothetical protein